MSVFGMTNALSMAIGVIQSLDPDHPIIPTLVAQLQTDHGLTIRRAERPDFQFAVESPVGSIKNLPTNPDKLATALDDLLKAQEAARIHAESMDDIKANSKLGTSANPTQFQIDNTKIRQFTPRGREIKPKLTLDDLFGPEEAA